MVKDFYCKGATKPRQEERVCNVNPCPIWYVFQSLRLAFVFTSFIFFSLYMHLRIAISVPKRSNNGITHKVAARVKCKELRMLIEIVFGDVLS